MKAQIRNWMAHVSKPKACSLCQHSPSQVAKTVFLWSDRVILSLSLVHYKDKEEHGSVCLLLGHVVTGQYV